MQHGYRRTGWEGGDWQWVESRWWSGSSCHRRATWRDEIKYTLLTAYLESFWDRVALVVMWCNKDFVKRKSWWLQLRMGSVFGFA